MKKFVSILAFAAMIASAAACCGNSGNSGKSQKAAKAAEAQEAAAPQIAGKWNIVKVNGEEVTVVADAEKPFIEFNAEENTMHGNTGVNIMNGSYTLDGQALTFGNAATTMMAGPQENMAVEQAVLGALAKVTKVEAAAEGLNLLDAEGNVVMELSK